MEEKRKVSTDALETLGTIIQDGGRDAIHLAVEPVIAGERLKPGEHIGIANGKATSNVAKFLGIVDPFLKTAVKEGEKFWLIVVSDAGEYGERWSNEGEYLLSRGSDASGDIPSKVWDCVEIVTGKKVTMRPTYFSCTC